MMTRVKRMLFAVNRYISIKYTVIFFCLMAVLYIFSLFGSMFGTADFTYAEF